MRLEHFGYGLLLVAVCGCGGQRTYPVRGKVVLRDGTVLSGGWIVFEPVNPDSRTSATADINADGTFQLGTRSKSDGALPGLYRVVINPPLGHNAAERVSVVVGVHPKYRSYDSTPFEVVVAADSSANQFLFEVEAPPREP
jgi:hypothetical protein